MVTSKFPKTSDRKKLHFNKNLHFSDPNHTSVWMRWRRVFPQVLSVFFLSSPSLSLCPADCCLHTCDPFRPIIYCNLNTPVLRSSLRQDVGSPRVPTPQRFVPSTGASVFLVKAPRSAHTSRPVHRCVLLHHSGAETSTGAQSLQTVWTSVGPP